MFYVIIGILIFGALGIWIEVYQFLTSTTPDASRIIVAMITFFLALVGTSAVQLAYDALDDSNKIMLALALLLLVAFSIFAILLCRAGTSTLMFVLNVACSLSAVWVWWIANAKTGTFNVRPDAPTGGDISRELPGTFDGFTV